MVNISKRMISSDLTMSTDANDGSWSLAKQRAAKGDRPLWPLFGRFLERTKRESATGTIPIALSL